jgi:Fis family transcriptional regulator
MDRLSRVKTPQQQERAENPRLFAMGNCGGLKVLTTIRARARKIEIQQRAEDLGEPPVFRADRTEPLRECVRNAMRSYLRSLDGHEVTGLHEMVLGEVEHPLIETLLDYTQGNQTRAARLLGLSRSTLRKKMVCYGIRQED